MSNKGLDKLMPLDRALRRRYPVRGFCDDHEDLVITIRKRTGFELFNTRPYHNYETWSDGYYIEAKGEDGWAARVEAEDLDDALSLLLDKVHPAEKGDGDG